MKMIFGTNVPAKTLFDAIKQSLVMKQKGYNLLYNNTLTEQKNTVDGYGLCYVDDTDCNTYIHVRIYGYGLVSSFEYSTALDKDNVADNDMNDLLQELKQRFR